MWTRQLLKQNGKVAFRRNYWTCVAVSFIAELLGVAASGASFNLNINTDEVSSIGGTNLSFDSIPDYIIYVLGAATLIAAIIGICFSLLVSNVVSVGCNRYFLENREHKTEVGQLFYGFKNGKYGSNVYTMFRKDLSIVLHTLLFIIPGIIKAYSYTFVPYILAENPDLDTKRVLKLSSEMMNGHKMEFFVLQLSFFGWALLNTITFGVLGIFWVNPYMNVTFAEFYAAVKAESIQNGIVYPGELPGVYYQEQTVEVV